MHPFAFKHAVEAAIELIELMRPAGESNVPDDAPLLDQLRALGKDESIPKVIELMEAKPIGAFAAMSAIRDMERAILQSGEDEEIHALKGVADVLLRRLRTTKADTGDSDEGS
jgi:hypothetical protein